MASHIKMSDEIFVKDYPLISVIIPCYNSALRLPDCLKSIKEQTYPQNRIEYIIVDDESTDNTREIAEEWGCFVCSNGTHNIERGKSIGVEHAKGDYIFLIDDDNRLPNREWLCNLVTAVVEENAVGGQASYFDYNTYDSLANRYASLYAINDPTVFYLNRRDKLMQTEQEWSLPGDVLKETELYWKIRFSKDNLLTIGSQGFLVKRELLISTSWTPYLYHMDTNMELVIKGFDTYIMLKDSVIHKHSDSIDHFIGKLKRNIRLFYSENEYRKYKYDISCYKMIYLGLIMSTFFIPLVDAIKGYIRIHDIAWFVHPIICFRVAIIYSITVLKNIKKI